MSPASRSKSKEKSARAAAKEQQKASSKPSPQPAAGGNGIPASAYNPVSGTFHTLETSPGASPPPHGNGRFRNIDETDEHSGSSGTGAEYDSVSNNDSCSGESEDQKEKPVGASHRHESIPGADNDKREKIRQKNERKHQRQRERRAQELHERCNGFLMSRKLESLAQQLVAMGFSSERATMALILNEGRVEESVAWLFEAGEEVATAEQKGSIPDPGGNLKIDIAEELARIAELELRFKCTKQEVQRVVVACEGDLDEAADMLKSQKQEPAAPSPKPEETADSVAINSSKLGNSPVQTSTKNLQVKAIATAPIAIQQKRDERDFNYTRVPVGPAAASTETANRNLQSLRRIQPKAATDWVRSQQEVLSSAEKRWPSMNSSSPSVTYSLASSLQVASLPGKAEAPRYVLLGSADGKNMQSGGTLREPVIMMQRPQSLTVPKQNHPTTSLGASPSATSGWYQNGVNGVELMKANSGLGQMHSVNMSTSNPSSQQQYYHHQGQYQPFGSSPAESAGWNSWNTTAGSSSSASLAVPSSLGLFTGWGSLRSSGSSSPVDWSTGGSMPECDYTNVDWSLEPTSSSSTTMKSNGLWMGLASYVKSSRVYEAGWVGPTMEGSGNMMRPSRIGGLHEGGVAANAGPSSSAGSHEWTSPFAGKDLFSIPRQFVTSPSL